MVTLSGSRFFFCKFSETAGEHAAAHQAACCCRPWLVTLTRGMLPPLRAMRASSIRCTKSSGLVSLHKHGSGHTVRCWRTVHRTQAGACALTGHAAAYMREQQGVHVMSSLSGHQTGLLTWMSRCSRAPRFLNMVVPPCVALSDLTHAELADGSHSADHLVSFRSSQCRPR